MEDDHKTCKEKEVKEETEKEVDEDHELLADDDGKLIQVDHKLHAQDFDFDSKFVSRFAVCTFLVGCYWFYPEILVRNPSSAGFLNPDFYSSLVSLRAKVF